MDFDHGPTHEETYAKALAFAAKECGDLRLAQRGVSMTCLWIALTNAEKMKALIDLGGMMLTAAGLSFAGYQVRRGVQQYQTEQRWRRKDYAAREYDRLVNDRKTGLPMQMLDWDARRLPLLTDANDNPVLVAVDRRMLGRALMPHWIANRPDWGEEETVIRDYFDAMLERLSSFEIMIAEGLIQEADLKPYLSYWIALIGDPNRRSEPTVIYILWLYIDQYGFTLIPALVKRFGYRLQVPDGFDKTLEEECRAGLWSRDGTIKSSRHRRSRVEGR